jgi:hypothetical protein
VARVDTVEERVGANEDAIVLLDKQNVALETLIQQGLSDIPSIQAAIDSLQLDNVNLWELTTSNAGRWHQMLLMFSKKLTVFRWP